MPLPRRLEKLRRSLSWRWAGSGRLPLFWHVGRPNFGDDINPTFFERLSGRRMRLATDRGRPHLLGAGSILERATPGSVVCGSGFLEPPSGVAPACKRLVAVRGERSASAFHRPGDLLMGDPLVLVDGLVAPVPKAHRVGLVPHVTSVARWRSLNARNLAILDPADEPWRVIRAIASCEVVLSQSLHGLIVADAFGVPNAWIAPSDAMRGGRFKFDDYFSTLDAPKEPVPEGRHVFDAPERCPVTVGRYRFSKADYRAALVAAIEGLAEELGLSARSGPTPADHAERL